MATRYVAKDGNDSNSGADYANAKLTIAGALAIASSGDTISIGPGVYNEAVSVPTAKNLVFQGDGYVILDGTSLSSTGFTMSLGILTVSFNDIIVRNFTTGVSITGITGTASITFTRCRITGCTTGVSLSTNGGGTFTLIIQDTLVDNNTTGFDSASSLSGNGQTLRRCTFAKNGTGISKTAAGTITINRCVVAQNTTRNLNITNTSNNTINYNCIYFDGSIPSKWNSTDYTALATWQSASSQDAASIGVDPLFTDSAKGFFGLHTSSTVFSLIFQPGQGYGAGYRSRPCISISKNDRDGHWANRILDQLVVNGSDNVEVDSGQTEGTFRSGVINFGFVRAVRFVNTATNLDKDRYTTDVPDYDNADVDPKRMTMRYRKSNSSFVNGDASPSWTEIEPGTLGDDVNTTGQYWQFEVTLRTDGV